MNYEELVESKKSIGNMSKEELFTYCNGLLDEIWEFEKKVKELLKENTILKQTMCDNSLLINENALLKSIIKEVREYITNNFVSYEDAIKDLRLKVSYQLEIGTDEIGELLEILDKVGDSNDK